MQFCVLVRQLLEQQVQIFLIPIHRKETKIKYLEFINLFSDCTIHFARGNNPLSNLYYK